MGRKPHKLIQEYFSRGAKLQDSSNRYQHTCKACGQKFPKGRVDGLIAHLLRKCPGISQETRQHVLLELVERPNQNGSYNQLAVSMRNEQLGDDSSFAYNQNMSALETLAEVSRQQLDTSSPHHNSANPVQNLKKRKRRKPNEAQQRLQSTFAIRDDHQLDPQLLALEQSPDEPSTPLQPDLLSGIARFAAQMPPMAPTARMVPDQLALAASAANQMMPPAEPLPEPVTPNNPPNNHPALPSRLLSQLNTQTSNPVDPQLERPPKNPPSPAQHQFPIDRSLMLTPRSSTANPDMPHVHFYNNFLLGHSSSKRVRGRFSDVRRKEVQEVRKQGACIRCRMLKKPCSGGTPCTTCQNVESARLWKIPCLRARMADEFDLFSAGVQTMIAYQEINDAKNPDTFGRSARQLVATNFPKYAPEHLTRFKSVQGQSKQDVNGTSDFFAGGDAAGTDVDIELTDTENQDVTEKMAEYFKGVKSLLLKQEPSLFMRVTLQVAVDLAMQKMDPLLSRALDLWVATRALSDPHVEWAVFSVPALDEESDKDAEPDEASSSERVEILASDRPLNHRLLTQQLRGFTEKRASQVAKNLLNDLEKRLLQRQQNAAQHFETFITAIILLNCIERMCWLYNTWAVKFIAVDSAENAEEAPDAARGMIMSIGDGVVTHPRGNWPLGYHLPHGFVEKGTNIANLVTMLLKMRGIPPSSVVGQDGVLRLSISRGSGSRRGHLQGSRQNGDHDIPNDELVAHLAQAAAAATVDDTADSQEARATTDIPDSGELSLPEEQSQGSSNQNSRLNENQSDGNAMQSSVTAAWFEQVRVTEEQLRTAQAAESFDENDCRCWDLRFIAQLMLSDE